jgi:hypothetical protein
MGEQQVCVAGVLQHHIPLAQYNPTTSMTHGKHPPPADVSTRPHLLSAKQVPNATSVQMLPAVGTHASPARPSRRNATPPRPSSCIVDMSCATTPGGSAAQKRSGAPPQEVRSDRTRGSSAAE